jgi:hypothetical protein
MERISLTYTIGRPFQWIPASHSSLLHGLCPVNCCGVLGGRRHRVQSRSTHRRGSPCLKSRVFGNFPAPAEGVQTPVS